MPQIEITEAEQRAWQVFSHLLGYKDNALATGQELERSRQRIIDLQSEMQRVIKNCDKRIQEVERACRERMEVADKRIAVLQDDFDEAIRELTEITTRAHILKDGADEIIAAAAASRHAPKTPRAGTGDDIKRGMEREMFGTVEVPPIAEMRPRQNMAQRFMDEREEDRVPEVLLRGPMKPEERESVEHSNDPLKALVATLKRVASPSSAPDIDHATSGSTESVR